MRKRDEANGRCGNCKYCHSSVMEESVLARTSSRRSTVFVDVRVPCIRGDLRPSQQADTVSPPPPSPPGPNGCPTRHGLIRGHSAPPPLARSQPVVAVVYAKSGRCVCVCVCGSVALDRAVRKLSRAAFFLKTLSGRPGLPAANRRLQTLFWPFSCHVCLL